jgi:hypothetical protein
MTYSKAAISGRRLVLRESPWQAVILPRMNIARSKTMVTYEDVRPGDTFIRRSTFGHSEIRRILPDGTSELVKRLHDRPDVVNPARDAHTDRDSSLR